MIKIFLCFSFVLCPIVFNASGDDKGTFKTNYVFSQEKNQNSSDLIKKEPQKNEEKNKNAGTEGALYEYKKPEVEDISYGGLIFRSIFVLLLFVGGFYWFYKFITKKTQLAGGAGNIVDVLSVTPIGANKFIQIVDIGGHVLVLGVSDNSVNLVKEITSRDEVERIKILSAKKTEEKNPGFPEFVSRQLVHVIDYFKNKKIDSNKVNKKNFDNYINNENLDYLKNQKERLKKMNNKE